MKILINIFLLMILVSCAVEKTPGGEITIRNDILDKEFNSFSIDQVITSKGAAPYSKILHPSNEIVLPFKNITSFRVVRRYEDHSKVYIVKCPSNHDEKVLMKLIDIHSNRIKGSCKLIKKGEMKVSGGLVRWEN